MVDNTFMKKALTFKSNYIFGVLIAALGIGIPFMIWGIIFSTTGQRDFPYHMTMLIFGVSLFLIGLIAGDVPLIIFKLRATEIDPPIPEELPLKIWRIRWPFYIGGLLTLIAIGIIGIIYLCSNNTWPLF